MHVYRIKKSVTSLVAWISFESVVFFHVLCSFAARPAHDVLFDAALFLQLLLRFCAVIPYRGHDEVRCELNLRHLLIPNNVLSGCLTSFGGVEKNNTNKPVCHASLGFAFYRNKGCNQAQRLPVLVRLHSIWFCMFTTSPSACFHRLPEACKAQIFPSILLPWATVAAQILNCLSGMLMQVLAISHGRIKKEKKRSEKLLI